MISIEELAKFREIEKAATPGPWDVISAHYIANEKYYVCETEAPLDAKFMSTARNSWVRLLDEIERLNNFIEHNLKEQLFCERTQGSKILVLIGALEKIKQVVGTSTLQWHIAHEALEKVKGKV